MCVLLMFVCEHACAVCMCVCVHICVRAGFHTGFFAGGGDTWQPMQAPPPPINIPSARHIIHRVVTN